MTIKMAPKAADKKAEAFIAGSSKKGTDQSPDSGKVVVNLRMDADLLGRIDAAAKRMGISRTAWLHVVASKALDAA